MEPRHQANAQPKSTAKSPPRRILFVCIGNSCRSQMAEALARHLAADVIEAASAGVTPLGQVSPTSLRALEVRGVRADGQFSKSIGETSQFNPELIVNLSGIPGKSLFPFAEVVDWEVEDPYGEELETHMRICDDIEARVKELAKRLRKRKR
jgi:arsenate reductase